jgi:hypothetical protein
MSSAAERGELLSEEIRKFLVSYTKRAARERARSEGGGGSAESGAEAAVAGGSGG